MHYDQVLKAIDDFTKSIGKRCSSIIDKAVSIAWQSHRHDQYIDIPEKPELCYLVHFWTNSDQRFAAYNFFTYNAVVVGKKWYCIDAAAANIFRSGDLILEDAEPEFVKKKGL